MYSKEDLINSIGTEFHIINHLFSTIDDNGAFNYRPSESQRSLKELLHYMSNLFGGQVEVVLTGDPAAARNSARALEEFDVVQFPNYLQESFERAQELLSTADSDLLKEKVSLYGAPEAEKGILLVNFVLKQIVAYRMQLFLYIKASCRPDIGTSDVWMGRSAQG